MSLAALWNAVNFALETNVRKGVALGVPSTKAVAASQIDFNAKRLQLTVDAHVTRCLGLAVETKNRRPRGQSLSLGA